MKVYELILTQIAEEVKQRSGAMFPKPKKIKNKKLLAAVRLQPCGVEGCGNKPEAAHVKPSIGDIPENVCPLCWWHHEAEQHVIGWPRFKERHPEVMTYKEITDGRHDPELWDEILERMVC
jgi:hypothetical protein